MIEVTVKSLAKEINTSVEKLIKQFLNAGLYKSETDLVTEKEKEILLIYLNKNNKKISNKLHLQKKIKSTLNILSISGKNKLVNIEIRKKHSYVKGKNHAEQLEIELKEKKILNNNKKLNFIKNNLILKKNINKVKKEILIFNKDNKSKKIFLENKKLKNKIEEISSKKFIKETKKYSEKTKKEKINKNFKKLFNKFDNNTNLQTMYHIENRKKIDNDRKNRLIKNFKNKKNIQKLTSDIEEVIIKRKKNKEKENNKKISKIFRSITIRDTISISELANKMAIKSSKLIKIMMKLGLLVTIKQIIDQEMAQLVAEELGFKVILKKENDAENFILQDRDIGRNMVLRAPVVTVMGHVDHGKTSLLDYIRSTNIIDNEVGGITQHIGAYYLKTKNGKITFLDTPGHSAFTSMRSRGVKITDIVILVVAADDGVMPQTIEAIQHAKAANVPIIVAINKIDKKLCDLNRIRNELAHHNLISEEWGGKNIFVNVSAKSGLGIDELLNAILLQSEILELYATDTGMAKGVVLESSLDKGKGPSATILVQEGTLKKNDIVLCGLEYGRIRGMYNEFNKNIIKAIPSMPVKIIGLSGVPLAGDQITVVRNEKKARQVSCYRQKKFREIHLEEKKVSKVDNIFSNIKNDAISELLFIIKADVQGSVEAIRYSLLELQNDKIKINIIRYGVGDVTENDSTLALASHAIILGFNIRVNTLAKKIIDTENLDFRCYSIIYHLIDDIKKSIHGIKKSENKKKIIGLAEVRNVFNSEKFGIIAGCMITNGYVKKNHPIRIIRKNKVIYEGELESLRRYKDDINEVKNGMECGIGIKNFNDVCPDDIIEVFKLIKNY